MDQLLRTCWFQATARVQWEEPAREDSGLFQDLPGLSTSHALVGRKIEKVGKSVQQSTCHSFISLSINNSSLQTRLSSNAFLCSCNETKPRWRWPNKHQRAWETGNREQRRKGIFQEQVRMAYLSSCNSTRHQLQLASNQGSLCSQISQSFHYKPHLKVRQLIASFLYDLCRKKKQNLIAVLFLILFLLTLWFLSLAEHITMIIQGRHTSFNGYFPTFTQDKYILIYALGKQGRPWSSSLSHQAISDLCTSQTGFQENGYSTALY